MNSPKIIFAGTPDFAVASLAALVAAGIRPCSVLTQPDRPAGRGKQMTPSPVKKFAVDCGLPLLQPKTLRDNDIVAELAALEADVMVVAAYGLILPQNVLDIPRVGCLNVHASLLPRWRGAAPIQAAILAGDRKTGACLMSMEAVAGRLQAGQQDDSEASYAAKITSADAAIDWHQSAVQLGRQVRAYNPVPGAWFMLGDERIKCWRAHAVAGVDAAPGAVLSAGAEGILVACGDGALRLESLQRPGKRAVSAAEFAAQRDLVGRQL